MAKFRLAADGCRNTSGETAVRRREGVFPVGVAPVDRQQPEMGRRDFLSPAFRLFVLEEASTRAELAAQFGSEIVNHEKIVIHDACDPAQLIELGTLPSGGSFIPGGQCPEKIRSRMI